MKKVGRFFADLWFLMKPYFVSSEWKSAWALLAVLLILNLTQVGLGLVISFSRNVFFTALQEKHAAEFFRGLFLYTPRAHGLPLPGFVPIAVVLIANGVVVTYLQQWLQIRWQRWMTARFIEQWLDGHAHFRLMLTRSMSAEGSDNPDQRIAEDISSVTDNSLTFSIGLISNIVTIISYGGLLWALSGPLVLLGMHIPGYLLWSALLYSVVVTWISHLVGRPLAGLTFAQQRFGGNFRFSLVKVRENTEAIAISGGEGEERRGLRARFSDIYGNFIQIMNRSAWLSLLTGGFTYVSEIFPLAISAPRFFTGRITFGTLTQIQQIFGNVQDSLLWFMSQYAGFAAYAAQVERLATFQRELDRVRAIQSGIVRRVSSNSDVDVRNLALELPDGRTLFDAGGFDLLPGLSTALTGPSGTGKSTLFRALAGIWPFARGEISGPPLDSLFLPQKPYLPEGTLRRVLCYPQHPAEVDNERLSSVIRTVGLERLILAFDDEAPWSQRLSPGEQQRVALARALLLRPSWLFMDEATSSLDAAAEAELFAMLRRELPDTTLVSITHREGLARLHDRILRVSPEGVSALELA